MWRIILFVLLTLSFSGHACAQRNARGWIEPMEAIREANEDPLHGMRGHFVMTVKAMGSQREHTFLNSERDYRDQRNLTVAMKSSLIPDIERRLGVSIKELKGRRIVVQGVARRVRIGFFDDKGRPTGLYYFQTQVHITSATQVEFAN